MKLEEGKTYRIRFVRTITLDVKLNEDTADVQEVQYNEGEKLEAVVYEIQGDNVILYFPTDDVDGADTFSENVPIDSFEVMEVKKVTWEKPE